MGFSIKKLVKKTAGIALGSILGPMGGIAGYGVQKFLEDEEKKKAKEAIKKADNALLAKEAERTNAANMAFEAERKKKEKRQMGLGSAISGSDYNLG